MPGTKTFLAGLAVTAAVVTKLENRLSKSTGTANRSTPVVSLASCAASTLFLWACAQGDSVSTSIVFRVRSKW